MSISDNFLKIKQLIAETEVCNHRPLGSVTLLAVSKGQPTLAIENAYALGQEDFGESYIQEAIPKIQALKSYPLRWHFIGPIQSNKAKIIAENFDWVHSLCRDKIAELFNRHRPKEAAPLQVCIQVNLTDEKGKSGIRPEEAYNLAKYISTCPRLQLRGLMLIPPLLEDSQAQYPLFLTFHQLLQDMNNALGIQMDTLSMGMSHDFIQAIRAGSTLIRLGRSFFG